MFKHLFPLLIVTTKIDGKAAAVYVAKFQARPEKTATGNRNTKTKPSKSIHPTRHSTFSTEKIKARFPPKNMDTQHMVPGNHGLKMHPNYSASPSPQINEQESVPANGWR